MFTGLVARLLCFFLEVLENEVSQSKKKQGARSARGCGIDGVWAAQRGGDIIVR